MANLLLYKLKCRCGYNKVGFRDFGTINRMKVNSISINSAPFSYPIARDRSTNHIPLMNNAVWVTSTAYKLNKVTRYFTSL